MGKTTQEKCEEIVKSIFEMCHDLDSPEVSFSPDWGKHSMTISIEGLGHSHVGHPGCDFEEGVRSLHQMLCHGSGLSFVPDQTGPSEEPHLQK